MKNHSNKEVREAIKFAIANGWTVKESNGHAWGILYCPINDKECRGHIHCQTSIWSTPKNPSNHARQIMRIVKGCIYYEEKE